MQPRQPAALARSAACVTMWTSMSPESRIVRRRRCPGRSAARPAASGGCRRARAGWRSPRGRTPAARRARRRRRPGGRCRRASRPAAAGRPGAAGLAPVSPSERATCTASRSPPDDRAAMRAARRISVSPSGPPVSATTTRSRVSQVPSMSCCCAVALQRLVDLVGGPEQGELAQRGEVADPEVVAQRGVDLLGGVDVAVRHPAPQRLGRHVDELDLVGRADHRVGHASRAAAPR